MKLDKKKDLAAKVLGVGRDRVILMQDSLNEIKEAITRQDIMDLHKAGAIQIRDIRGRKTREKRKYRRGMGRIKKRVDSTKQDYVKLTRKLRATSKGLLRMKKIDKTEHVELRKMIRASRFKSRRHLLEHTEEMKE